MLLNFLWFGLILLSVLADLCSGQPFSSSQAALAGAAAGIELTLSLAGPICLWSALARAMEQTGLTAWLCRALRPGLRRLFPVCAADEEGFFEPVRQSGRESAGARQRSNAARRARGAADAGAVRRGPCVGRDVSAGRDEHGFPAAHPSTVAAVRAKARRGARVRYPPGGVAGVGLLRRGGDPGGTGAEAMLENLTELLLPGLLLAAGAAGLRRKRDVYGDLLAGAQDGLRLLATLAPSLLLMLTAVTMLRESGFFDWLTPLAAPVFRVLGIPPELAPLVLIRPLSGSAALAVGTELMQRYGVDSLIGRTAAVMLGSSETTFYTISVYFGAAGVRGTRYAVPAALIADLTGFCMAALSVRLFFRGCLCTFPDFSAIIVKLMT